jgi:hypothetical protein
LGENKHKKEDEMIRKVRALNEDVPFPTLPGSELKGPFEQEVKYNFRDGLHQSEGEREVTSVSETGMIWHCLSRTCPKPPTL